MSALQRNTAIVLSGVSFMAGGAKLGYDHGNNLAREYRATAEQAASCAQWLGHEARVFSDATDMPSSCEEFFRKDNTKLVDPDNVRYNISYQLPSADATLQSSKGYKIAATRAPAQEADYGMGDGFWSWVIMLEVPWFIRIARNAKNRDPTI